MPKKPWLESTRLDENGHTHIFRTDSMAELIKRVLQEFLQDYGADSSGVQVLEEGEGWMRIELVIDPRVLTDERAMTLYLDLMATIGGGKGWYECKDSGEGEKNHFWWITRHKGGPLI